MFSRSQILILFIGLFLLIIYKQRYTLKEGGNNFTAADVTVDAGAEFTATMDNGI